MLLLALSAGCHAAPYVWVQSYPREAVAPANDGRIAVGDVVEVRVFGQDSLNTKGRVRLDGSLTLPLVGQVTMAREQPGELAKRLEERLRPFVNDPRVSVIVAESQVSVSALGELKQPGILLLDSPANVLQAIARAGGMTDFADRSKLFVLRTQAGKTTRIRFRYEELTAGSDAALGFALKSGDVLVVE